MNRREELIELENELEYTPAELDNIAAKAVHRAKRSRRKAIIIKTPLFSFCSAALLFILLVNLFPAIALAMSNVPVLKELVSAVAIDPSLKAAVENDYYQAVGNSQTKDDVTVTVDYMIADAGHLSIFYHVNAPVKAGLYHCEIRDADGELSSAPIAYDNMYESGKLEEVKIDYLFEENIQDRLTFNITVNKNENFQEFKTVSLPASEENTAPTASTVINSAGVDYDFSFELYLEEQFLHAIDTIEINQWIDIKGQHIFVRKLDIYPTQARLVLDFDPGNSSYIDSLDIYITDEEDRSYTTPKNGYISCSDSENTKTFFIESNYFSKAKHLLLSIDGIKMIDKDKQYGIIDYTNRAITNLPEGISIDQMELNASTLTFTLKAKTEKPDSFYSIISSLYHDKENTEYNFGSWQQMQLPGQEDYFFEEYRIENFDPNNQYRVEWLSAPHQKLADPVSIELK